MYSYLEEVPNLIDSVFDILDDMDFDMEKDSSLLQELYTYVAKITNDRYQLLSFIQTMIEEHGEEKRHPLLSQLYKIFIADYHMEFCSPIKLKMKVQILKLLIFLT